MQQKSTDFLHASCIVINQNIGNIAELVSEAVFLKGPALYLAY